MAKAKQPSPLATSPQYALLAILLAACGSAPSGDDDACDCPDAAVCTDCEIDAGVGDGGDVSPGSDASDAGDAGDGRPQGSPCDLLLDQCAQGLTCRYTGTAGTPFSCQPYGPRAAMQSCVATNDCGANLGCFPNGGGTRICLVFCDTSNPARCEMSETCYDQGGLPPEYPDETGVCGP